MTLVGQAAAHGQLGEKDAAQKALKDLQALKPDFASTVRKEWQRCSTRTSLSISSPASAKLGWTWHPCIASHPTRRYQ